MLVTNNFVPDSKDIELQKRARRKRTIGNYPRKCLEKLHTQEANNTIQQCPKWLKGLVNVFRRGV